MALKRLRLIQRRKALGFTQEALADQVGCERTAVIRWERAETEPQPWVRPRLIQALRVGAEELSELLADAADVPGERDGFTLVTSVPSAHDGGRKQARCPGRPGGHHRAALLCPVREWAASLALLTGSPPDVGTDEVAELEQAVTVFRRWDASGIRGRFGLGRIRKSAAPLRGLRSSPGTVSSVFPLRGAQELRARPPRQFPR